MDAHPQINSTARRDRHLAAVTDAMRSLDRRARRPIEPAAHTVPGAFACDVLPDRSRVFVCPRGELDIATIGAVDEAVRELVETGFTHVVVDLRAVTFLDATGIRLALDWDARARADGFTFELVPGPPAVQRAFELMDLVGQLPFRPGLKLAAPRRAPVADVAARR